MILSDQKSNGPQFSKLIVIVSILIAVAGCAAAIFIHMEEAVSVALIGACGSIAATTIIWNLKKSQAENTMKIYMATYKEILELKQEYNSEECSEIIENMENNIEEKMNDTINSNIEDATSMIELKEV